MQKSINDRFPGGLWPVMLTPFGIDNSIDFKALETLIDFYISAGADGLFTNCYSSEMYQLNEQERLQITKTTVDFSRGRVPVISSGSFYGDAACNIEFIKKIYDQGVDAVILISSVLVEENEGEDVLKEKLEKILNATGNIPLGMYECPLPYKRGLSTEMMKWLADTGRFFFHKDTSCKADIVKEKIEAVENTCLKIYNAHTPDAYESMHDGAYGLAPISANFFPELYAHFFRLFYSGDFAQQKKLSDRMVAMDVTIHQQYYPWAAKAFLKKRGLNIQTKTRMPQSSTSKKDTAVLELLHDEFHQIIDDFEIEGIHVQ